MKNFKTLLAIFPLLFILVNAGWGQTINEDFTSGTVGNAVTVAPISWSTNGTGNGTFLIANTTALTKTNYNGGGGNYVAVTKSSSGTSNVGKIVTGVSSSTNTFYTSFLLNVGTVGTSYFAALTTIISSGTYNGRIYMQSASGGYNLGIAKSSGTATYGSTVLTTGTTYLVIVKYVYSTGTTSDDQMYLWVNPTISSEPSTGAAEVSDLTTTDASAMSNSSFGFTLRSNTGTPNYSIDGIKVAYASTSATAWTNLNAYLASGTPPTVTTQAVESIGTTTATGNGNITDIGSASVTEHGVCWNTSTNPTTSNSKTTDGGAGTGAFTSSMTGLSVNTYYYVRAYATNTAGTSYGDNVNFYTLANVPSAPTVNGATATSLNVTVNVNSNPASTEFAIQETGGQYVQSDGTLGGSAFWQTSATWGTKTVTGLSSNTSYTFKVKARNGANTETAFGSTANASTLLSAPVATTASLLTSSSFTANWNALTGATSYKIDVSLYPDFATTIYATDLFISEYVEGSSNNKYIEIYNGTGSSVNLSNYNLRVYNNGVSIPSQDVTLSGTLANGQTIVYKNASATIYGGTATSNAAVIFNGNDAVSLYKTSTSSNVDIIGRIGEDPGTAWTSGSHSTLDKTLRRKSSVTGGITTNPGSGFPTLETEWDVYSIDNVDNLGSHTYNGTSSSYVSGYQDLTVNSTSQSVTGLSANTTYYYRVRGVNANGTSSSSNVITTKTCLYFQNFDGTWTGSNSQLPDANWTAGDATGVNSWRKETEGNLASWTYPTAGTVRPYSTHSANFHSYEAALNSTGTLNLNLNLSATGNKVLTFYYTNGSGSDNLKIYLSTDGGSTWTTAEDSPLATYTTGNWEKKTLNLGNITSATSVIRFKATSDYGYNDIGIDNVEISVRNVYTTDVGTFSIDVNPNLTTGSFQPLATVKNFGSSTQSFSVTMSSGAYTSTKSVSSLTAGNTSQVTFDSWSPSSGIDTITVTTSLTGDEDASNNTLTKYVAVSDGGWTEGTTMPITTRLGSGVGYTDASGDDYLFSVGGYTSTSPQGKSCYKYNVTQNTWTQIGDLPEGRFVLATAIVGTNLYAIGGAGTDHLYKTTVYRYDLTQGAPGSWSTKTTGNVDLTAVPYTVGWCKAVAYNDGSKDYIYLAGGYNGSVLNNVYVYDVTLNTWTAATSITGARFGGAFSITGSTLVYVAGASTTSQLESSVYEGAIGGTPTSITWSLSSSPYPGNGKTVTIPSNYDLSDLNFPRKPIEDKGNGNSPKLSFPPGSMYGFDAAPWGTEGVIVGGGSPYGDFSPADPNPCYIYLPASNSWVVKQYVPTPVAGSSLGTIFDGANWKLILASGGISQDVITNKTQIFTDGTPGDAPLLNMTSLLQGYYSATENQIPTPVTIELRTSEAPYTLVESKTAIQNNNGICTVQFNNASSSNSYYIVVKYLNGLETWSAEPQRFTGNVLNYDFSIASSQAYGNNMVKVGNKWCIYSGDINQDGSINAIDWSFCWNDRNLTGMQESDVNGDNVVNELDRTILSTNKSITGKFPAGFVPAAGKIRKNSKTVTK